LVNERYCVGLTSSAEGWKVCKWECADGEIVLKTCNDALINKTVAV
jgi:hypothetical protein